MVSSYPMNKRLLYFLLAISTGLVLHFAWPTKGFVFLIFVAFLPLLYLERQIAASEVKRKRFIIFLYSWLAFALFNLTTTLWVKNAHVIGPIATTLINGALMAGVITLFSAVANKVGYRRAYFGLPFIWISLEMLHQFWDLSFPWLDLGNAFANHAEWIQWYSKTGHLGGTLWVWIVNLTAFEAIKFYREKRIFKTILRSIGFILLIVLPISSSVIAYNNYQEKGFPVDVVVVQPNIEAFEEKWNTPERVQVDKFLRLAHEKLDTNVDLLVGPETLLGRGIEEKYIHTNPSVVRFGDLVSYYGQLNIIYGATTFKVFDEVNKTPISLPFRDNNKWYELYNTAYQINRYGNSAPYHKSKLVVAAEQLPFRSILQPLIGKIIVDLGGMTGTHGTQKERSVFTASTPEIKSAPIICWEAEFGEFVTGFTRNGANIFLAITNDGWWGDTDGHRQHMHYMRMRAIENRRAVARSANTGISCFINQRGDVTQAQAWATDAVIRQEIMANDELTFYAKNGDLIGRVAVFITVIMVIAAFVQGYLKRAKV
jgi:apolipoprotein N-acyltransferase